MGSLLYTLVIVCVIFVPIYADIDYSICNPLNFTVRPPPPPELSKSYKTRVEWKWLETGTTADIEDTYDGITSSGSLDMFIEQQEVKMIFDYKENQFITYTKRDKKCLVNGLGTLELYDNKLWLTSLHLLYSVMKSADVAFMGEAVVRSTNTTWFQSCLYLYQFNTTVQMNIYFSEFGWGMALSRSDESIPVRVELTGSSNGRPFHAVGDYIDFDPNPIVDETIMQVPPGTFCPGRLSRKPLNILPNSFSIVFEEVNLEFSRITYESIWFHADKRLIRRDYKQASGSDPDPSSEVFDFNLGIHYNIDPYMGSCQPISYLNLGNLFVANNGNRTIRMMTADEFFHVRNAQVQYIGSRVTRGVECDVWVGLYLDNEANMNFTIEWYFTKDHWIEAVGGIIQPASFFRMDIWQGDTEYPLVRNVLQFNSEPPTQDVYDVAPCFPSTRKARVLVHFAELVHTLNRSRFDSVTISGKLVPLCDIYVFLKGSIESVSSMYLKDIIHTNLVNQALIPPLRISKVSIQLIGNTDLYMDGMLLDNAPLINPSIEPPPPYQHSLNASFEFLNGLIKGRWKLVVNSTVDNSPVVLESRGILKINYRSEFTTTVMTTPSTEATPPPPSPTTVKPMTPSKYNTPPTPHLVTAAPCNCTQPICPTTSVVVPSSPCPTIHCPTPPTGCPSPKTCPTCTKVSCPACPVSTPCSTVTPKPCPPVVPRRCSTVKPVTAKCPPVQQTPCPTNTVVGPNNPEKQSSSGLSNGATAAVAIVMLIVGCFFGVVIVIVYKRIRGTVPADKRTFFDKYLDNEDRY